MLKLRSLAIELTPRCNQQCVYCYNAWRGEPASADSELSTDRLKTLVDRVLDQAELQRVTLTGGEPFLREDVFEIVDYLNGRDLAVAFISNGGVIGDEIAGHLASRRVDYVQITLAGPDASTHDAVCGAGSFERTTGAMRTLAAAGVAVGGSYLCTQHNATMAREIYETMLAAGARSHFAFNRFNPSGHAQEHMVQLMPSRGDVLTALSAADGFAAAHQCKVHCTMPIPRCMIQESDYPHIKFGQCAAGSTAGEFAVDPHGRLKLCTLQRRTIGSVFDDDLASLIEGSEPAEFRGAVPTFCRPCPHREICLGGCGAAAEWAFGSAGELDPFLAQHVSPEFGKGTSETRTEQVHASVAHGTRENGEFSVAVDPWFDLVYHVLSHVPLATGDAASVYSRDYMDWCGSTMDLPVRRGTDCDGSGNPSYGPGRSTVPTDAEIIGQLIAASPSGSRVQAWPLLHEGLPEFLQAAATPFRDVEWSDDRRGRLARSLAAELHPILPDLFRTALRTEWLARYQHIWPGEVRTRSIPYCDQFIERLGELAERLPELREVDWVLCHPLRIHGRVLHPLGGRPTIVVGVADRELGVSELHPVMQGCHEMFVTQSQLAQGGAAYSTVAGRDGYEAFRSVEQAALERGEKFFAGTPWQGDYRHWRAHFA